MARTINAPTPAVSAWTEAETSVVEIALRAAGVKRTDGSGFGVVPHQHEGVPGAKLTTTNRAYLDALLAAVAETQPEVQWTKL